MRRDMGFKWLEETLPFPEVQALTSKYVMNTYPRLPISLVKGEGVFVWDSSGKKYLDFIGGIAVCALGHAHPRIAEAVCSQARRLVHCSNLFHIELQARLAKRLIDGTPFGKAFFCNSGAEANEAAIKLARKFSDLRYGPGRREILTAVDSFHGRTLAALAATGQPKYQKGFEPLIPGFRYVPFNDAKALEEAISPATCAVMLEPIQGESGVRVATAEYLQEVRRITSRHGLLLILDEVQTGLGRTGKMFAFEHYGITPDIMTLAKALAGGLPMGAMLARDEVAQVFQPGNHASTFGGNPLVSAAALAFLEVLEEENLIENSRVMGDYLMERLRELGQEFPIITEVRGRGLMVGLGLTAHAKEISLSCMEEGLLVNAVGDTTLRFLPPLIVTREEIDQALGILRPILNKYSIESSSQGGGKPNGA